MIARGRRVRVVGVGLIGTSLALGLRAAGVEVVLDDTDPGHLQTAVALGAGRVDDGGPVDVSFVAVRPAVAAVVIAKELRRFPNVIVSDTTSVKAHLQAELESLVPESFERYVGGHPIAGRERSGPVAARPDLFRGRPWVLTARTGPARRAIEELVEACGAQPLHLDADCHDQAVALTSHLPQLVSSALAGRLPALAPSARAVVGAGFADLTRIAESDPGLWAEIAAANAVPLSAALRGLAEQLSDLAQALDTGLGDGAVRALVGSGRVGRRLLPGKHGGPARDYAVVGVIVSDAPGELARLFAAAGEAAVNIEDLRVDHAPGLPLGAIELSVAPGDVERLRATLRARGWTLED